MKKLPPQIKEQFSERLDIFMMDPHYILLNNHSVAKRFPGCRSINVNGDYRAIFNLIDDDNVMFIDIGTHAQLYG